MALEDVRRAARRRLEPGNGYAGNVTPEEAWEILSEEPRAVLVDVRTVPEWSFVGMPDLSALRKDVAAIAWQSFPSMEVNPNFAAELQVRGIENNHALLFLCRSGARSKEAARAMSALGYAECYNVLDGFEGPHDERKRRGTVAGWKVAGLPWRQG
jgi:rhodanese-related sulfurtransferase